MFSGTAARVAADVAPVKIVAVKAAAHATAATMLHGLRRLTSRAGLSCVEELRSVVIEYPLQFGVASVFSSPDDRFRNAKLVRIL